MKRTLPIGRLAACALAATLLTACAENAPATPPPAAPAAPSPEIRARLDEVQRLASQMQYDEAVALFEAVRSTQPAEVTALDGLKMVVVYAEVGDQAKHEELTRWLVDRHRVPASATDAERSVKGYIVRAASTDPEVIAHAVVMTRYASEHAAADGEGRYQGFFDTSRGVAAYRAGNVAEAIALLATTMDHESLYVRSLALPVQAMAELARGNRNEAAALAERARRVARDLPKPGSDEYAIEWTDVLISRMVLEEMEAAFAKAGS
jgi:predicted transcriptional regulator